MCRAVSPCISNANHAAFTAYKEILVETIDSRKRAVYWIHTFVYFLITFCFGYLPFHALTPFGMTIVGIFIGLLYGWTFIGFVWPSMMSIFALGLCGYFKTPQAAFANAFSNHLVIFMLLVLVFTAYCEKSGINKKLSCWFLSRKGLAGKPWCFTFMVLLGTFVVSFLVDGNAVVFLVWNLMYSVFDEMGYRKGDRYPAYLLAGVAISAILSFGCKPWGNVCILAIGALEASSGGQYTVDYLTFMATTIPLCILFIVAYFLVMKYVFKPDVSKLRNLSEAYLESMRSDLKLNPAQKIAGAALIVFMGLMLLPNLMMGGPNVLGILGQFNFLAAIAVVLIALCVMRLEGMPLLDFDACARDGIHWHVFWITAAALPVSAAVSSDAAGITAWLGEVMNTYFKDANVIVFLVLFSIVINLLTQFTHNVSLVLIAVPIAWQVSQSLGLNPVALTVLVIIAAACAYATPAASTVAAVLFSNVDWIGVRTSFKAGFSAVLAGLIVLFLFGFPVIAMVYGFRL